MKNSKHKSNIYLTIVLIAFILFVIVMIAAFKTYSQHKENNYKYTNTPTFYLHGYGGTENSIKFLIDSAIEEDITQEVVKAKVSEKGTVTFEGELSPEAKNPVIEIILEDNTNKDLNKNAQWIQQVIIAMMSQYHFDQFNFVAHSMGNQSFSYYMLNYGDNQNLPKLNKQVSLAGNFNGEVDIDGLDLDVKLDEDGKPNKMLKAYKDLLPMKKSYPKTTKVLNIYGDIEDGTHSDNRVTNVSSKSLRYLVDDKVSSYEEFKVIGQKADHSELHDNTYVTDKMNQFLWGK